MHRGYTCLWRKVWWNPLFFRPGKKFSRFEAWLYITNMLATGTDGGGGRSRGEFVATMRQCADIWSWSPSMVFRFLRLLEEHQMISRVEHPAEQGAEHFIICNYEIYNPVRNRERNTRRNTNKEVVKKGLKEVKQRHTPLPADADVCVSPKILFDIYQQQNHSLPEVKALTSERLKKCRSRINQAVRDGCLEQYLADFTEAVKKAQQTPFLRGEGARGWRASFDWFVANHVNIYGVLEGKYDGPAVNPNKGGVDGNATSYGNGAAGRTSRGDPIYIPRQ